MAQLRSVSEPQGGSVGSDGVERQVKPGKSSQEGHFRSPAGVKACTQCGTTKTPQWREGPLGPKTLCNACGVKIFRQNKKSEKQAKVDDVKKKPVVSGVKRKAAEVMRVKPKYEDECANEQTSSGGVKRPLRKAAAKAAHRTYEFATTGDWPEEQHSGYCMGVSSTTSGISAQASDSAEEVVFEPRRYENESSPVIGPVAPETQAAVDLLTLSLRDADTYNNSALQVQGEVSPHNGAEATSAPLYYVPHVSGLIDKNLLGALDIQLPDRIPEEKRQKVYMLRDQLDAAIREVSAADAAVRAVAKILAQKQDVQRENRNYANNIAHTLTQFILALDDEYELTGPFKKHSSS